MATLLALRRRLRSASSVALACVGACGGACNTTTLLQALSRPFSQLQRQRCGAAVHTDAQPPPAATGSSDDDGSSVPAAPAAAAAPDQAAADPAAAAADTAAADQAADAAYLDPSTGALQFFSASADDRGAEMTALQRHKAQHASAIAAHMVAAAKKRRLQLVHHEERMLTARKLKRQLAQAAKQAQVQAQTQQQQQQGHAQPQQPKQQQQQHEQQQEQEQEQQQLHVEPEAFTPAALQASHAWLAVQEGLAELHGVWRSMQPPRSLHSGEVLQPAAWQQRLDHSLVQFHDATKEVVWRIERLERHLSRPPAVAAWHVQRQSELSSWSKEALVAHWKRLQAPNVHPAAAAAAAPHEAVVQQGSSSMATSNSSGGGAGAAGSHRRSRRQSHVEPAQQLPEQQGQQQEVVKRKRRKLSVYEVLPKKHVVEAILDHEEQARWPAASEEQ